MRFVIKSISTKLSQSDCDALFARVREQNTTPSEYLRRLIREDNRRADSEALAALSLDELARNQAVLSQQIRELQHGVPKALLQIASRLDSLQQHMLDTSAHQTQKVLDAYAGTADLVVAAIHECHTILDADNTILETIERRLRAGGK